jgi:predicted glycosyltransferase
VRLDETFPIPDDLKKIVFYSGMVGPPPLLSQRNSPSAAVVVSAGGGAVGRRLLETAIAAKPLTSLASERWLVLTGPNLADRDFNEIRKFGERNGITVRRFVPDLAATLASAELSISQAGYNTVADVLSARCRAVFVPFSEAGETEQARRASLLRAHGFGVKLDEAALSPASLAAAAEQALALPPPSLRIKLNGAARTGALLASLLAET